MPFWETKPRESLRHVPTRQAPARLPFCPHPPCRIHRSHGCGREARHRGVWLSTPQNSSSPSVLSPRQPSLVPFPFHAPLPKSPLGFSPVSLPVPVSARPQTRWPPTVSYIRPYPPQSRAVAIAASTPHEPQFSPFPRFAAHKGTCRLWPGRYSHA